MKVIFLEVAQDHGGARKSTIELAGRLAMDSEIDTHIVDFYGSCSQFVDDVLAKKIPLTILDKRDHPFILQNDNILRRLLNYVSFIRESMKLRKKLKRVIEIENPDFFIVNNSKTLSIIPKSHKFKIVLFARGWFIPSQISMVARTLYKKKIDVFIAVSQATRHALFSGGIVGLEKIFVVKNGIDMSLPIFDESKPKKEVLTLIHSGSFLRSKGHHVTVEVSRRLKELSVPHKIFLTGKIHQAEGSEQYYDEIIDKIQEYNLNDEIEVIVNKNDILEYFRKADIFLHPSDTEGLPRVVMESMALKTLVIANPVGGVTDFVLDGFTGFLTDYNNVDDYVKIILKLQANPILYQKVVNNAYQLVLDCYSPSNQVDEIKRILNKC